MPIVRKGPDTTGRSFKAGAMEEQSGMYDEDGTSIRRCPKKLSVVTLKGGAFTWQCPLSYRLVTLHNINHCEERNSTRLLAFWQNAGVLWGLHYKTRPGHGSMGLHERICRTAINARSWDHWIMAVKHQKRVIFNVQMHRNFYSSCIKRLCHVIK